MLTRPGPAAGQAGQCQRQLQRCALGRWTPEATAYHNTTASAGQHQNQMQLCALRHLLHNCHLCKQLMLRLQAPRLLQPAMALTFGLAYERQAACAALIVPAVRLGQAQGQRPVGHNAALRPEEGQGRCGMCMSVYGGSGLDAAGSRFRVKACLSLERAFIHANAWRVVRSLGVPIVRAVVWLQTSCTGAEAEVAAGKGVRVTPASTEARGPASLQRCCQP